MDSLYFYCAMCVDDKGQRYVSGTFQVTGIISDAEGFTKARNYICDSNKLEVEKTVLLAFNKV